MWDVFPYFLIIVFFSPLIFIAITIVLALVFKDKFLNIVKKVFAVGYFIIMLLIFSLFGIAVPGLFF